MEFTRPFQIATTAIATALGIGLFALRFCGAETIPPKPPVPAIEAADVRGMIGRNNARPQTWLAFLDKDAATAGLLPPVAAELRRAFPYEEDTTRRSLKVGSSFHAAGLTISLSIRSVNGAPTAVLDVANDGVRARAFRIVATSNYSNAQCGSSSALFESRTVVLGKSRASRNECTAQNDLVLDIGRVESMEIPDLSAYYISRVPPGVFGLEHRLAREHRALFEGTMCMVAVGSAVRTGFENGTITWRDLTDFFARHRCDSYQFPTEYRAYEGDGALELPAVDPG